MSRGGFKARKMVKCNICLHPIDSPIYVSSGNISITSINQIFEQKTKVFFCKNCGHLQTSPIRNLEEYYSQNYNIFVSDENEDLLYKVKDGRKIFRLEHQNSAFIEKVEIPINAKVLDYGCAKSAALKRLLEFRPDITPYAFDVSDIYIPFWEKFILPNNWATYSPKPEWVEEFDVVSSFFSLEHVADPRNMVETIKKLITPGGKFFCIVPNVFSNTADFVVLDHVNHFSETSLRFLLEDAGFEVTDIDSNAYEGATIAVGVKLPSTISHQTSQLNRDYIGQVSFEIEGIAKYWSEISERIRQFENSHPSSLVAIYGSGFYGTFLTTCLNNLDKVKCFIDQSQYRQGKTLFGKPIIAPEDLSTDVNTVYVALNPRTAKDTIAQIDVWKNLNHKYFYL